MTDKTSNKLVDVLDPALVIEESNVDMIHDLLKLGLSCTWPNPDARPNMNEVLSSLLKFHKEML